MFYLFLLNKTKTRDIICAKFTALALMWSVLFSGVPLVSFAEEIDDATSPQTTEEPLVVEEEDDVLPVVEEEPLEEEPVFIETGDAVAVVDVVNTVNTNDTNVLTETDDFSDDSVGTTTEVEILPDAGSSTSTEENPLSSNDEGGEVFDLQDIQTSSTTPEVQTSTTTSATTSPVSASSTNDTLDEGILTENYGDEDFDITVTNNNDAIIENTATSTAQTGENNSSGNNGDSLIVTGNAVSSVSIANTVNTNIINSEGFLMFLDSFSGELDLRNLAYWDLLEQDQNEVLNNDCNLDSCYNLNLLSDNNNSANIVNNVVVEASTGGNNASDNNNSAILTGNAYASANVVNVANTNIIDSNYLLITANNFGNLSGDIIFPSAAEFSRLFFGGVGNTVSNLTVSNNNTAVIENNVNANAVSGGNSASGNSGESFIMTGDAGASSNVINQINQNVTNFGSFSLLLRVHGHWSGSVYAPPEELMWNETANGVEIYNNNSISGSGGSTSVIGELNVQNDNNATITNNIDVYALTGENHADGNEGHAGVLSGEAYASANVVNVANTNIIGQNWTMAIINIFGDWNGNVSFGQPDLWIGGQVDTRGITYPEVGGMVDYHYTIVNNSDTLAMNVRVTDKMSKYVTFNQSVTSGRTEGGNVVWDIGDLDSGKSIEVEYTAYVNGSLPAANTLIENIIMVASDGTDANIEDNTDIIVFRGYRRPPYLSSWSEQQNTLGAVEITPDPILSITKTNNATTTLFASTTVDYTIIVQNDGGEAYDAILFDTLIDNGDNVIYEQYWNLDTIYPDEEITIEYSIVYDENTIPGIYTNHAQVEAIAGNPSLEPAFGRIILSSLSTSSIEIASSVIIPESLMEPEPEPVVESEINEEEDQISLPILKLNNEKLPEINRKRTSIGYKLYSLIKEDMFTPVPWDIVEEEGERGQVVVSTFNIVDKLGGFAFMGSFRTNFSTSKFLTNNETFSNPEKSPYNQLASIFDSLVKIWALPYSWAFILVLLGFTLTLLMRTRIRIVS